jgi:hypothetical protein
MAIGTLLKSRVFFNKVYGVSLPATAGTYYLDFVMGFYSLQFVLRVERDHFVTAKTPSLRHT